MRVPKLRWVFVAAAVVLVAGVAAAVTFSLFTQTLPTTKLPPPEQVLVVDCSSTLVEMANASTASTAWATFGCSASLPALHLNATGTATATFTLPAGAADLWLVANDASITTSCANAGSQGLGFNLTSNPNVAVTGEGGLSLGVQMDYCVDGTPGATITSFTVSWTD